MLKIYDTNSLIIHEEMCNVVTNFYSTDNEETFYKNNKKLGKEWKYYNSNIDYQFNSLGYRTKEIKDLDQDFLLTFGCSYTEGVGLDESDIWTTQISEFLNLDLYNHAKQASGIDIQCYNALLWNVNNLPKPKIVIVQWPHKDRKSFGSRIDDNIIIDDYSYTNTLDGKWWGKRYVQDIGEQELNIMFWYESFNNVWKQLGVPVLNFTWDSDLLPYIQRSKYRVYRIKSTHIDTARDCQHDGVEFHKMTSNKLKSILQQSNFTDKI
jgi:hypothetical protein